MSDAEQTLREYLNKILDEINYIPRETNIRAISSGGGNFTSAIFLVNVTSPNKNELKLFAKVAIVKEEMRKRMNADWLFDTERFVYGKLAKIYNKLEEKMNIPEEHRYTFPKCYGCNAEFGNEIVVMENLAEKGYNPYSRFLSMDWAHGSKAVENLAKFHALSFAFAKYEPEEFEQLTADMPYKIGRDAAEEIDESMKDIFEKMVKRSLDVIKDEQKESVGKFIQKNFNLRTYNRVIGNPVIAHGDYRMSNILFCEGDNSFNTITVDYQTVHAGNPVADLLYFIFLGSDEEFRKEHFKELLDHYYKNLEQALERLSIDAVEVYPRNKFDDDVKELLTYGLVLGVAVLPIVTVEAESAPKMDQEIQVEAFVFKANELYAKRFSGIVNDCFAWGIV